MNPTPESIASRLQRIQRENAQQQQTLHSQFLQLQHASLERMSELIEQQIDTAGGSPVIQAGKHRSAAPLFDTSQLVEFATRSMARCFGPEFAVYEGRRHPRIPNGDLLLMSRVVEIDGKRGQFNQPASILTGYDVPLDAWFYVGQNFTSLPYSLWMEIALQPCGFLSAYLGTPLMHPEVDYYFRNLDGNARILDGLDVRGKTVSCAARVTSTIASDSTIIQKFTFHVSCEGRGVFEGESIFGFFPPEGMANQVGLDGGKAVPARYESVGESGLAGEWVDLTRPGVYFTSESSRPFDHLAGGQMHFLDRVFIANKSPAYLYGVRDNDPRAWFYTCHFYQDPVMPGSLGVEAILEAVQLYALRSGLGKRFRSPVFAPVLDQPMVWKYRGQILPGHQQMKIEVNITRIEEFDDRVILEGDASLWADAVRIYEVKHALVSVMES